MRLRNVRVGCSSCYDGAPNPSCRSAADDPQLGSAKFDEHTLKTSVTAILLVWFVCLAAFARRRNSRT
jgi:hypothetical protein